MCLGLSYYFGWPAFYAFIFGVGGPLFFMWAFVNIGMYLTSPRETRLWRKGGGDPWFDTLDPPFNSDPPEVRYQELFREKERQEMENR